MIELSEKVGDASLRSRVLASDATVGVFAGLGSPVATEICATDLDWVLIDLEHGSSTEADLLHQLLALSGTTATPLVRVIGAVRTSVSKALDLGARGIMFPRIDTADQAADAIGMMRHPPRGTRGVAAQVRSSGFGAVSVDAIATTSENLLGIIQIETSGALQDVSGIADVDGVDVLFVGPGDLSYALAVPGQRNAPTYLEACDLVVREATRRGKAAGVLAADTDDAARYYEAGFRFIAVGSDSGFIRRGVQQVAGWASTVRGA